MLGLGAALCGYYTGDGSAASARTEHCFLWDVGAAQGADILWQSQPWQQGAAPWPRGAQSQAVALQSPSLARDKAAGKSGLQPLEGRAGAAVPVSQGQVLTGQSWGSWAAPLGSLVPWGWGTGHSSAGSLAIPVAQAQNRELRSRTGIPVVIREELQFCCYASVQGSHNHGSSGAFSKCMVWNLPFELQCLDANLVFMFILFKLFLGESTQQCLLGK